MDTTNIDLNKIEDKENQTSNAKTGKRGSFTSWRGNKYPSVKLRGYYSDITSNQNVDKVNVNEF